MGQQESFRYRWKSWLLLALAAANLLVWFGLWQRQPSQTLKVYFLDVGQGDAILVESPSRGRVLIDGGPNRKVMSELGKILPFADKRIDVVLATHPDADHIGGLPEVVSRYRVSTFIEPGVKSNNGIDDELYRRLQKNEVETLVARRGLVVNFGDGAKLYVLFPDQDVSGWDTNDASIVAKLVYGEQSFLLTGDAPLRIENILMNLDAAALQSTVLKAGHHGSRTSTSLPFAQAVSPLYAIISAGKDNRYGHPHSEVLSNLEKTGSVVRSTAKEGAIVFQTDGEKIEIR